MTKYNVRTVNGIDYDIPCKDGVFNDSLGIMDGCFETVALLEEIEGKEGECEMLDNKRIENTIVSIIDLKDKIALIRCNGSLLELAKMREAYFYNRYEDSFFDNKELREKYDPDFELSNKELFEKLDNNELSDYLKFLKAFEVELIQEYKDELRSKLIGKEMLDENIGEYFEKDLIISNKHGFANYDYEIYEDYEGSIHFLIVTIVNDDDEEIIDEVW